MSILPDAAPAEAQLLRSLGLDTVAGAFAFTAGEVMSKPNLGRRERIRIHAAVGEGGAPATWYLKRYGPQPILQRLRTMVEGEGRIPARREARNIQAVAAAGVPTMRCLAAGRDGWLGGCRSYIVMTGVPGEALERCLAGFAHRVGMGSPAMAQFNAGLLALVKALHSAGLAHRDLYASHIFLDESPAGPRLYLIDLARVFRPSRARSFRWRVKDLAGLKYSLASEWVERFWDEFLDGYLGAVDAPVRRGYVRAIDRRVAWMRRRG
jgi:tRNA A-37 threonylcarbamoyl transferase component Bud32